MFETLHVLVAFGCIAAAMVSTELWRLSSERLIVRAAVGDERLLAAIAAHESKSAERPGTRQQRQ